MRELGNVVRLSLTGNGRSGESLTICMELCSDFGDLIWYCLATRVKNRWLLFLLPTAGIGIVGSLMRCCKWLKPIHSVQWVPTSHPLEVLICERMGF